MNLVRFSLTRYRAFDRRVDVELAPITVVIGSNHAGKTTLCRAPWFISQPFALHAASPFLYADPSLAPAPSLLQVARGLSGFEAELRFRRGHEVWTVDLHAVARVEAGEQPMLARLNVREGQKVRFEGQDLEWSAVQRVVEDHRLMDVHAGIDILGGLRQEAELSYPGRGFVPLTVGFRGEHAPNILEGIRDLSTLNDWAKKHLGITYAVEREGAWSSFRVIVEAGPSRVLLADSGTGLVQVLPVAAALLLVPRLPALYSIEHPELHLHPHAHRAVAELLIAGHKRHPGTCFLVETHSDTLVLRLRRAVVEKRLSPEDVQILHVDFDPAVGSSVVRPIRLNDRGVPDWWPKGVFAEELCDALVVPDPATLESRAGAIELKKLLDLLEAWL